MPEQKPNEAPAETVVRGDSGVNGSGSVNINGKRPNHNMDDIKTPETQVKGFISDADRMKLNSWKNKISDELYLKHKMYLIILNIMTKKQDGLFGLVKMEILM